jgi:hypothetical protein
MPPDNHVGEAPSYPLQDLENGRPLHNASNEGKRSENDSSCTSPPTEPVPIAPKPSRPKAILGRITSWLNGPQPSRLYVIVSLGGSVQLVPLKTLRTWLPRRRHKIWLLLVFYVVWLVSFISLFRSGFSNEDDRIVMMSCTSSFWYVTSHLMGECHANLSGRVLSTAGSMASSVDHSKIGHLCFTALRIVEM